MKTLPLLTAMCLLILIISISKGVTPFPGEVEGVTPLDQGSGTLSPLILSENANNKVLRLYTIPSPGITVLYDQWEILLFGNVNDTYKVKINGVERFNGSMVREVVNLTFDASALNSAGVVIKIGNISWKWDAILINHQEIGIDGIEALQERVKYTESDISKARLKGAGAVLLTTIVTIPFVWIGVRQWRKHQGVREW